MKTTLNKIRKHLPCSEGWAKLLTHLGKTQADDEPLSIATIVESNGLDDALWCLRSVEGHDKEIRLFIVWCARQVQHLMIDKRSLNALDVAERYAKGEATDGELRAAGDAAWKAARAAAWGAAGDAAWGAAWAAKYEARDAAEAARDAAWGAAGDAAWAAGDAAWKAARAAAWGAAKYATWKAARAAQEQELLRLCAECEVETTHNIKEMEK